MMNKIATALIVIGLFVVMGAVGTDDYYTIELATTEGAPSLLQTFLLSIAGLVSMGLGVFLIRKDL